MYRAQELEVDQKHIQLVLKISCITVTHVFIPSSSSTTSWILSLSLSLSLSLPTQYWMEMK